MNYLEKIIYRNFPFILDKKINKKIKENIQDSKKMTSNSIDEIFSQEELSKICTKTFLKYIYSKKISINPSGVPEEIKHNPEYVDFILSKNIGYISSLPEEMIVQKHIKLYEEQIKIKGFERYKVFPIPSILKKSNIVLEEYLNYFDKGTASYSELLDFLNLVYDNQYIVDKALEIFEKKYAYATPRLMDYENKTNLFKNDKILFSILNRADGDIMALSVVPTDKLDKAYDIICEMIKKGKNLYVNSKIEIRDFAISNFKNNHKILETILSLENFDNWSFLIGHINVEIIQPEYALKIFNYVKEERKRNGIKMPIGIENSEIILEQIIRNNEYTDFSYLQRENFSASSINLIFKKARFDALTHDVKNNIDKWNLDNMSNFIKIDNIEDFVFYFNKLSKDYNIVFALIIIKKYKDSNIKSEQLEKIYNYYLEKVKYDLNQKYKDQNLTETFINKVFNGTKNPLSLYVIHDKKEFYVETQYCDILSTADKEIIQSIPAYVLERLNKKHINEIANQLKNFQFSDVEAIQLAIKMYVSIGLARSKDLLNPNIQKNYGLVTKEILLKIFKNISLTDIYFKKEGNNFIPEYNEQWIRLIFGENYKIKNTPIRNYLGNFEEKKKEIEELKIKVRINMNLTDKEKEQKCNELEQQLNTYIKEINEFITNVTAAFNEWDIITEEFFKAENKSKLKIKMNPSKVNEIIKLIKTTRNLPTLELRDKPLLDTDIFDFVGYDTQYTRNPETAKRRAVELSRRMDYVTKKKFPNISITENGYSLRVYGPQDRKILSAGYKSNCCFRPNGNADNHGKDNSLLNYCVSTEYGGGVEIRNSEGEIIMFSPLLRNGNVLMIHSIETKNPSSNNMEIVHKLLVKFAERTIEESNEKGDNIDFVTITDLHYLNPNYIKGFLPLEKKFNIYNVNNNFCDMYNNLDHQHALLASSTGKTYNDIKYGEVSYSYTYPVDNNDYVINANFTKEEQQEIISLNELKNEITKLSNKRYTILSNEEFNYELLGKIRLMKKEYLERYKKLLSKKQQIDLACEYQKAITTVKTINANLGIDLEIDIKEITYGQDWYIIITHEKKLIANCLENGKEKLNRRLNEIKIMHEINDSQIITSEKNISK